MNWRPTASIEVLRKRASWLKLIRQFFEERRVLEVDTPVLSSASIPDPNIESLLTSVSGHRAYLQTSPEFYMKRLLAAGSGPIYQLAHAFRQGEQGKLHSPEFTLLEWYQPGYDQYTLMQEIKELVCLLCELKDEDVAMQTLSYGELFQQYDCVNPFEENWTALDDYARSVYVVCPVKDNWQTAMDWLLATQIQPHMKGLVFVNDFPASQAALARLDPDNNQVARRFELFVDGVEMANGFEELIHHKEQRQRFENENNKREAMGLEPVTVDENLLYALKSGMPETSGVALGLDRLLMWHLGLNSLQEVLTFDSFN